MQRSIYLNRDKKMSNVFRLKKIHIHRPRFMRSQRDLARSLLNPNPPTQPIPLSPVRIYASAAFEWVGAASFVTRAFLQNIPKGLTLRNVAHGDAQAGETCPLLRNGGRSMKFFNNADLPNLGRIVIHVDGTEDRVANRAGCSVVGRFRDTGLLAFYIYGELDFTVDVKNEFRKHGTKINGQVGELGGLWVMEYIRERYGITNAEVVSDCKITIGYITNDGDNGRSENIGNMGHRYVVQQLMQVRERSGDDRLGLRWVHRSFNKVADLLAKRGMYSELGIATRKMREIWGWVEKERRIGFAEFMRRAYADERF